MDESSFDERIYRKILHGKREEAVAAAVLAFRVLGYTRNFDIIACASASVRRSDDFYLPLRIVHNSKHINTYLEGLQTQLPLLHAASLIAGRDYHAAIGESGGSLTRNQLMMELVDALNSGEGGRSERIAAEMASRGMKEELFHIFREESSRRYSFSGPPLTILNSLRCISEHEDTLENGSVLMSGCLCGTPVSSDFSAILKGLRKDDFPSERVAENSFIPDEREDMKVIYAVRAGISDIAVNVIKSQLMDGVAVQHISGLLFTEALRHSLQSNRKGQFEFLIQNLHAALEMERTDDEKSGISTMELLLSAAHLTQLATQFAPPAAENQGQYALESALDAITAGHSQHVISILTGKHSHDVEQKIASFISALSVKYDQTGPLRELICHVSSSLHGASLSGSDEAFEAALSECSDYLAAIFSRNANTGTGVNDIFRKSQVSQTD
ncbi:MAG: hypothetical protein M1417_01480 [Candidatus Thermoplasmatota archaeon]|nr:hypothetical protein [Candidatus Thermoplasmatota archaeon]MCL5437353.1 hypothetical protein [Candidatus Thermoplasmatota archaeon]